MASFDENGKYIKTNWKAGDKITATKLNKIEESIEAVNDNDISRHVEADARLDALEAKDVAHDKEFTNIKNTIADNKAAAELSDYDINSRMTFLENELNEGIAEVHNVASTVDGKIAAADASMKAQVNQGKADMEAMVAEVEADLDNLEADLDNLEVELRDNYQIKTEGNLLPDSSESFLGSVEQPWGGIFLQDGIAMDNDLGSCGINTEGFFCYESALKLRGGASDRKIHVNSDNLGVLPDGDGWNLGSDTNRWQSLYLKSSVEVGAPNSSEYTSVSFYRYNTHINNQIKGIFGMNGDSDRHMPGVLYNNLDTDDKTAYQFYNDSFYSVNLNDTNNPPNLGMDSRRWGSIYLNSQPNVSSDRTLKENIQYVNSNDSNVSYEDMYIFVKDDLELATYNLVEHDNLSMGFIAQDLLVNLDGTDNKVGQMIVNPVAVPTEEEIEEGKPYPTLSFDMGMYTSVLAGALKEAINKIEQLEARIQELENK